MQKPESILMNDFKIVKCKKCDASLVEMAGKKLTHCIQCGYQFGGIEKKRLNSSSHARLDKVRESKTTGLTDKLFSARPELSNLLRKLQNINSNKATSTTTTKSTSAKTQQSLNKKSTPIWVTLIKWYIIISVVIGIITSLFK